MRFILHHQNSGMGSICTTNVPGPTRRTDRLGSAALPPLYRLQGIVSIRAFLVIRLPSTLFR